MRGSESLKLGRKVEVSARLKGTREKPRLTGRERRLFCSFFRNSSVFCPFMAESQQSHPSQQCPPVSPMDIESAQKKKQHE